MTVTQAYTGQLTIISCGECAVDFGLPTAMYKRVKRTHETFYCPAGHKRYFPAESDLERERRLREMFSQQLASRDEDIRAEKVAHAVTKGKLTRARNRANRGVCQHCQRTFANVQRHVASQHPEAT